MKYLEMAKVIKNKELDTRAAREFGKLSESSSQEELDRFSKRFKKYFEDSISEEQKAYERFMFLRRELIALCKADDFSGDWLMEISLADNSADPRIPEIREELKALMPLAKKWAEFCGAASAREFRGASNLF